MIVRQNLPLNQIEVEAAKLALDQIKFSPNIIQAGHIFSFTLTQYGVPYYKHEDLARIFLYPLYERKSNEGNQLHREDSTSSSYQHSGQ